MLCFLFWSGTDPGTLVSVRSEWFMKLLSLGEFLKEDYLIRLLNAWVLGEGVSRAVQG